MTRKRASASVIETAAEDAGPEAVNPEAIALAAARYDRAVLAKIETSLRAELAGHVNEKGESLLVVSDTLTAEIVAEVLQMTLRQLDSIEAERKAATAPLNQLKRVIDGWFKGASKTGDALVAILKGALAQWDQAQEAQRREALQLANAAVAQVDAPQLAAALSVANSSALTAKPDAVGFRRTWAWRVVNLHMMPKEYLQPNEAALDAHVKGVSQDTQPTPIPGVLFDRVSSVIGYRS